MLSMEDPRWSTLAGGYRRPFDVRPFLKKLEAGIDVEGTWGKLWEGLYHQGTIGEASLAAIPHLVRIHQHRQVIDWNTYAMAASVELARTPDMEIPSWTRDSYGQALTKLAETGLGELPRAKDSETVRSILSVLALVHGARTYARVLIEFTEDEVLELEELALNRPDPDA